MLSLIVFLPVVVAAVLALTRSMSGRAAAWVWLMTSIVELALGILASIPGSTASGLHWE